MFARRGTPTNFSEPAAARGLYSEPLRRLRKYRLDEPIVARCMMDDRHVEHHLGAVEITLPWFVRVSEGRYR